MTKRNRMDELGEIFEILVTSYAQKGGVIPGDQEFYWRPATDAYETDTSFIVQMDLAGMEPTQIEVLTDKNSLLVRGIRREITSDEKKHYHKMEISVGPFARRIPLTVDVDPDSAHAQYRQGFLFVTFDKGQGPSETERRQIDIER